MIHDSCCFYFESVFLKQWVFMFALGAVLSNVMPTIWPLGGSQHTSDDQDSLLPPVVQIMSMQTGCHSHTSGLILFKMIQQRQLYKEH